MEYRVCKGVNLSEIGVGCYSLAGVYGKKDVKEFKKMLNRAYDMGVTFFDTAEAYGDAEHILGETVAAYREDVFIATKVGVREGIKPNLKADYVGAACEGSLERLQTDYIDLYQVHFDDPDTPVEETVNVLDDLVAEGKIRYYGVGHLPVNRVEQYCKRGNVFSLLMELSAVARRARETLLPLCEEYKVGGIAFSTTGRGLLTGKIRSAHFDRSDLRTMDPLFQRENFQSGLRIAETVAALAKEYEKTPVQAALAWVLQQPGIVCALTGPSTVSHLEENCGGSGWSLSKQHLQELETVVAQEDKWLKKEQLKSVKGILSQGLPTEFSKAFSDLVYVMETAVLLELTTEKEILPVFHQLFALRKVPDAAKLMAIQKALKSIIDTESLHT